MLDLCSLAGAAGFEPANGGIKSRCLTTWRRPIRKRAYSAGEADEKGGRAILLGIFHTPPFDKRPKSKTFDDALQRFGRQNVEIAGVVTFRNALA